MKKLYLLCAAAIGLAFTACDDYKEPNPPAQKNEPVEVFEAGGVTINKAAATEATIDLNNITDVVIADISFAETFPKTADIEVELELEPVAETKAAVKVGQCPVEVKDGKLIATAEGLEGAFLEAVGKNPKTRKFHGYYYIYAIDGGGKAQVGYKDKDGNMQYKFGPFEFTITPKKAEQVIENAYYFVWGDGTTWNKTDAEKMGHSDEDVYDDPVFSLKVDITDAQAAAGFHWMVVPESVYNAGDFTKGFYGVAGQADAMSGKLALNGAAGRQDAAASLVFAVNMEELTYSISYAFPFLYTPGTANGNKPENSQILVTDNYTWYQGFAHVKKQVLFCSGATLKSGVFFVPDADGGLTMKTKNPSFLKVEEEGLYWITADVASLKYTMTLCQTWGVVGSMTEWADGKDIQLTPSADFLTWTGTVDLKATDEFKFRADGGWDINVGGKLENLVFNSSDNLKVKEDGKYEVSLNFGSYPYTATLKKK